MNERLAITNKNFKAAITVSSMKQNYMLSVNEKKMAYQINRNNEKNQMEVLEMENRIFEIKNSLYGFNS